jgi:hypothetical protein
LLGEAFHAFGLSRLAAQKDAGSAPLGDHGVEARKVVREILACLLDQMVC